MKNNRFERKTFIISNEDVFATGGIWQASRRLAVAQRRFGGACGTISSFRIQPQDLLGVVLHAAAQGDGAEHLQAGAVRKQPGAGGFERLEMQVQQLPILPGSSLCDIAPGGGAQERQEGDQKGGLPAQCQRGAFHCKGLSGREGEPWGETGNGLLRCTLNDKKHWKIDCFAA